MLRKIWNFITKDGEKRYAETLALAKDELFRTFPGSVYISTASQTTLGPDLRLVFLWA